MSINSKTKFKVVFRNEFKTCPQKQLSKSKTKLTVKIIIAVLLLILFQNFGKLYTTTTFITTILLLILVIDKNISLLQDFLVSYTFILIPFFIINGILTGSFIVDQIVWYNNDHNMGIRIGTIPFEDIFYGMTLFLGTIYLAEKINGTINNHSK